MRRVSFTTSLAKYSDRNDGAPNAKERDQKNCPDGMPSSVAPIPMITATQSTITAGMAAINWLMEETATSDLMNTRQRSPGGAVISRARNYEVRKVDEVDKAVLELAQKNRPVPGAE
jgi:hypothetical protein